MSSTDLEKRSSEELSAKEPQTEAGDEMVSEKKSGEDIPAETKPGQMTFPEGGFRAWSVVIGTSCVLFCTFGYANAFG